MPEVVTSETRAEFMAERLRLAPETEEKPEVKDDPKPEVKDADPAPAPEEDQDTEQHEDKPKKHPIGQRISELTEKRRQAEAREAEATARAQAAEARLRELEGKNERKAEPIDPDVGPKPKPDDYTDAFEYAEHLAEWTAKKALADNSRKAKEEAAKAEAEKVVKSFQQRVATVKAELPDYEEVLSSSDLAVTDLVRDSIIESDFGPKILYHLAQNPDVVEKLNSSKPGAALRLLGRLEAQFEKAAEKPAEPKPEPKPRVNLPDPITPISGKGAGSDNKVNSSGEFTGTYADWKALRAAGKV